jgi:hypothetical protein
MHNPFALLAEPEVTRKNGSKLRAEESVAANAKAAVIELEEGEADPTFKQQPRRKPKPKSPKQVEQTGSTKPESVDARWGRRTKISSSPKPQLDKLSLGMFRLLFFFFLSFFFLFSFSFSLFVSSPFVVHSFLISPYFLFFVLILVEETSQFPGSVPSTFYADANTAVPLVFSIIECVLVIVRHLDYTSLKSFRRSSKHINNYCYEHKPPLSLLNAFKIVSLKTYASFDCRVFLHVRLFFCFFLVCSFLEFFFIFVEIVASFVSFVLVSM